jgi:hypothetical protein
MRTFNLKAFSIAAAAVLFLSVSTHAQDKMGKMKKDTTKMSKMDHGKMTKMGKTGKMSKTDKMKKDSSKM